jgi:GTPase
MESRNRIALIGRPNVGKSTLFNKLTRTRKAVVRDEPGVTRDILIEPADWWGREFDVVDTGGLTEDKRGFAPLIREQTLSILSSVDLLVAIFDGRVGLCPEDRDIVRLAKETGRPLLLVVNKVDRENETDEYLAEFQEFGLDLQPAGFESDYGIAQIVCRWCKVAKALGPGLR